jgi:flavodoxin
MTVDDNKSFLLLFGTQTGNAKAIAERIADDAKSYGFLARLESMSSIGEKVGCYSCLVIRYYNSKHFIKRRTVSVFSFN